MEVCFILTDKRNLIKISIGLISVLLLISLFLLINNISGEVTELSYDSKSSKLTLHTSKRNITLSKNGKLKVKNFYRLNLDGEYIKVNSSDFASSLESYIVDVKIKGLINKKIYYTESVRPSLETKDNMNVVIENVEEDVFKLSYNIDLGNKSKDLYMYGVVEYGNLNVNLDRKDSIPSNILFSLDLSKTEGEVKIDFSDSPLLQPKEEVGNILRIAVTDCLFVRGQEKGLDVDHKINNISVVGSSVLKGLSASK